MSNESDEEIKKMLEASLFISPDPLSLEELSKIVNIKSIGYVKKILNNLVDQYNDDSTSLKIDVVEGNYIFTLKDKYLNKVSYLTPKPDISKGALRILAYISKNEPVLQKNVKDLFGSMAYDYIKELSKKGFLASSKEGRTRKIKTTDRFKEYFELNNK